MRPRISLVRRLTALGTAAATVAALGWVAATTATSAVATSATAVSAAESPLGNVALASAGATVTASGSEGGGSYGWTPDKAIDGVRSGPAGQHTSRWSSNYDDAAWITVQPAQPVVIDHVNIYWERACPLRYKLQVSVDGVTWVDASPVLEPTCDQRDTQTIAGAADPTTAYRFVRMQSIERRPIGAVKYGVSLWELEVWDSPEPVPAPLVPQPVVVDRPDQAAPYTLSPSTRVRAVGEARDVGVQLARLLRRSTGYPVPVTASDAENGIRIDVDENADYTVQGAAPTEESYVLDVDEDGVDITARTAHGAFNAVQTLRQLLPAWVNAPRAVTTTWEVPAIHVEDAPRFAYRGVMLDVARSFQDVETVKRYIDTLAQLKMSVLHLHLADDQGWRIEITNKGRAAGDTIDYTRLTRVSGRTAMNQQGHRAELGRTGYYTQHQYREIVDYARERFVTVVPEVDIPGHTNAALHAIPQLNTDRSLPAPNPETGVVDWNGTGRVGYSALDERHEPTYQFVRHVFRQLSEMTGGPYVHMGGDESHAMGHERYVDFVTRAVEDVKDASGVGVMGWTEYAEAGLQQGPGYWDGSVVQYWVGSGSWVRDFVAKGGKAVVSAAGGSYLDQKYDASTPIGLTWACSGDCDFPRYYSWDPTTTVSGGVPEDGVLGVEAPLWSETIRGEDQAFFLTLPRAAAVLETGWTPAARKDLDSFTDRLGALGGHLTAGGANYYESRRARWSATVAGTDVTARPDVYGTHEVGLIAAPGTKLSADADRIVPDRVTTDGDPASDSALTAPLTATLDCGAANLPVTFAQAQARDSLHAAGAYTARVAHAFAADTTCSLTPSVGDPIPVRVTVSPTAPVDGGDDEEAPQGPPRLIVGSPERPVQAGAWEPFELRGFEAGEYVEISVDGTFLYRLRTDERGRFDGFAVIPATTSAGVHVVTATQGERVASDEVRVLTRSPSTP